MSLRTPFPHRHLAVGTVIRHPRPSWSAWLEAYGGAVLLCAVAGLCAVVSLTLRQLIA